MKVAVFGAAGIMGWEVVDDLLFRGHEVIACVPDLDRCPPWGVLMVSLPNICRCESPTASRHDAAALHELLSR